MTKRFRTISGRVIRVKVSNEEAWRIRAYRLAVVLVPSIWMFAFAKAAGMI